MNFTSTLVLLGFMSFATACTSQARPVQSPPVALAAQKPGQPGELRHFYLLSPGPNATLVVTRSDVSAPAP